MPNEHHGHGRDHGHRSGDHHVVKSRHSGTPETKPPTKPHAHKPHHRRRNTAPGSLRKHNREVTMKRSPSSGHLTWSQVRELGNAIWDTVFEGTTNHSHHNRRASTSTNHNHGGEHASYPHDLIHEGQKQLEHVQEAFKHSRPGEVIHEIIAGYSHKNNEPLYHNASKIIDELMDEYDVEAREIVLRLVPELRHLFADEGRRRGSPRRNRLAAEKHHELVRLLFQELKLAFVKLDGRDCRSLIEYAIEKEEVDESSGSSSSDNDSWESDTESDVEPTRDNTNRRLKERLAKKNPGLRVSKPVKTVRIADEKASAEKRRPAPEKRGVPKTEKYEEAQEWLK